MKTELKAKFLQKLNQQKRDEGFTLIELLVVIIIIGILSAIALPSFLNQTAKARGAEAKNNVGSMNRGQQAYYLERQQFTTNIDQLGLGMDNSTDNFTYSASGVAGGLTIGVTNFGTSLKDDIKSYVGGVFYQVGSTKGILCEAINADDVPATPPSNPSNNPTCDSTTLPVK